MRSALVYVVTAAAMLVCAGAVQAQTTLAYSFEAIVPPNGPDGFFGLGATVSQEPTIGVTHGTSSLKYEIGVGGFVGARTESVPAALNDPPGVAYLLFDLTLPQDYPDTFANLGVTVFGHALNAPGGAQFGLQVQFADEYAMAGLTPGTYLDQRIDLDLSVGPYRPGESFNAIFGPGPTDLTVSSAFQFYVNKNVLTPITFYVDNVRLVVPEPATLALFGLGLVAMTTMYFRRRSLTS
jgi:PEP-CTERM motif-containing protein